MWVCPCTRHSSESLCSVPCCLCSFLPNCFLLSFESDVNRGPRGWFAPASGHSLSLMPIVIFEVSTSALPRHLNHLSWRLGIMWGQSLTSSLALCACVFLHSLTSCPYVLTPFCFRKRSHYGRFRCVPLVVAALGSSLPSHQWQGCSIRACLYHLARMLTHKYMFNIILGFAKRCWTS